MSAELLGQVREAIQGALEEFGVLTDWVVVAETSRGHGDAAVVRLAPPDSPVWRWRGLLHEALREDVWEPEIDDEEPDP